MMKINLNILIEAASKSSQGEIDEKALEPHPLKSRPIHTHALIPLNLQTFSEIKPHNLLL